MSIYTPLRFYRVHFPFTCSLVKIGYSAEMRPILGMTSNASDYVPALGLFLYFDWLRKQFKLLSLRK